jgi:hypothetical protein
VLFALVLVAATELSSWIVIRASSFALEEEIRTTGDIYAEQSDRIQALLARAGSGRDVFDLALGWRYRPGYRSGDDAVNAEGLRSLRDYARGKAPGTLRIAAFGDSFVYCSEVGVREAWPTLLEGAGDRFEVLNYGVGGYGTDQALLRYLAEGAALAPDRVLIGFAPINLRRNVNVYQRFMHNRMAVATKPRFVERPGGELELLPNPVTALEGWRAYLEQPERIRAFGAHDYWYRPSIYENPLYDFSTTVRLATMIWIRIDERFLRSDRLIRDGVFNVESEAFALQVALLRRFAEAAGANGARAAVLLLPDRESIERDRQGIPRAFDPLVERLARERIEVLDGTEAFRGDGSALDAWFMQGGHYSPEGNRHIASWLNERLRR